MFWALVQVAWAGSVDIVAEAPAGGSNAPTTVEWAAVRALAPRSQKDAPTAPGAAESGDIQICGDLPSSVTDLEGALERARKSLDYLDTEGMRTHLKVAARASSCLDAPPPPGLLARMHMLAGIAAAVSKDAESAEKSYRQALSQDPRLVWDDAITPDARPSFDRALDAVMADTVGVLRVAPSTAGSLWVDGVPLPADATQRLRPGQHLVQAKCATMQSITVNIVSGGTLALAVPCLLPVDLAVGMASAGSRETLGATLSLLYPGEDLTVRAGSVRWLRPYGATSWTTGGAWRRRALPMGATGVGLVATGVLYAVAAGAQSEFDGTDALAADATDQERANARAELTELQSTANGATYGALGAVGLVVAAGVWTVMAW